MSHDDHHQQQLDGEHFLGRDQILTADDLVFESVPVPEWGGTVRLRTLTGVERDDFELAMVQGREPGAAPTEAMRNLRARLAAATIVDAHGHRIFTEKDIDRLGMKSGKALDRVFDKAKHLSGLTEDDVEELAGNSGAAPSGSSITD